MIEVFYISSLFELTISPCQGLCWACGQKLSQFWRMMVRRKDSMQRCRYGGLTTSLGYTNQSCLQVVRMRLEEGRRIVGTLIPGSAMEQLIKTLGQGAEESEETIHWEWLRHHPSQARILIRLWWSRTQGTSNFVFSWIKILWVKIKTSDKWSMLQLWSLLTTSYLWKHDRNANDSKFSQWFLLYYDFCLSDLCMKPSDPNSYSSSFHCIPNVN